MDFRLRLITPAFLAGAMEKPAATPGPVGSRPKHRIIGPAGDGLRIPSLRGVLRFWFRAKEGFADRAKMSDLARRESALFGSTERGQGVRLIPGPAPHWEPAPLEAARNSPVAYLGYGPMNDAGAAIGFSSHNQFGHRDVIPAGTTFSFRAVGRSAQLEELQRCLLLLHLFGGVGGRSRRGFGSVAVKADFIPEMGKKAGWAARFEEILAGIWADGVDRQLSATAEILPYSGFSASTSIRLTPAVASPDGEPVLRQFYERFQAVRILGTNPSKRPPIPAADLAMERAEHAAPAGDDFSRVPLRLAFGLPYHPGYRGKWQMAYHGRPAGSDRSHREQWLTRRASPLFLKVFQPAPGNHFGVALFLRSEFFGTKDQEIGVENRDGTAAFPGYGAIDAYLGADGDSWHAVALP